MKNILVIKPQLNSENDRLTGILKGVNGFGDMDMVCTSEALKSLILGAECRNRRIVFAVALDDQGLNFEYIKMLGIIRANEGCFDGSLGGLIIDGKGELYTKSVARELVLAANMQGCAFIGRPLVEATGSLNNLKVMASNYNTGLMETYSLCCADLFKRISEYMDKQVPKPRLLVLYAGNAETSNTLSLWRMIEDNLSDVECREISLRDGEVWDCRGCSFDTCKHLGEKEKCFYGGVITSEVYPSVKWCDAIVLVTPNYNDAVGANITAFINRLTAICNVSRLYNKKVYAVICSGYSGSDLLAEQILGALNMNKSIHLPGRFAIMETANHPDDIYKVEGIKDKAKAFADNILKELSLAE